MAQGLRQNHTLLGLHVTGNQGRVDAYGQLAGDAEPWPLEASHSMTRILHSRVTGREKWTLRNRCHTPPLPLPIHFQPINPQEILITENSLSHTYCKTASVLVVFDSCWICGCWREIRFTYTMTDEDILAALHAASSETPQDRAAREAAEREAAEMLAELESSQHLDIRTVQGLRKKAAAAQTKWENAVRAEKQLLMAAVTVRLATSFDQWVPEPMVPVSEVRRAMDEINRREDESVASIHSSSSAQSFGSQSHSHSHSTGDAGAGENGVSFEMMCGLLNDFEFELVASRSDVFESYIA